MTEGKKRSMGDRRLHVPFVRRGFVAIAGAVGGLVAVMGCSGPTTPEGPVAAPPVESSAVATQPTAAVATPPEAAPTAPPGTADPAWVAEAVAEALAWEVMPGTTEEPDDGTRAAELRLFFLAHPAYADAASRAALARDACAVSTEAAHERLMTPPPKVPLDVAVESEAWRVVVAHASDLCTSDDWSYYTHEVGVALSATGALYAYGSAENDVVVVRRAGVEVARFPLQGQGYVVAAAARAPLELEHDMADGVISAAERYFGAR